VAIRRVINGGLIFCFDEPARSSCKRAYRQSACQMEGVAQAPPRLSESPMSWVRRRRVTWHLTVTRDRPDRGTRSFATNNTVPQGEKIILSKTSLDACMKTEVAMLQKGLTLSLTSSAVQVRRLVSVDSASSNNSGSKNCVSTDHPGERRIERDAIGSSVSYRAAILASYTR